MSSDERAVVSRGTRPALRGAALLLLLLGVLAGGYFAGQHARRKGSELAPGERLVDTATVIVAVRALARLESVSFHMERVIDLKQRQQRLFGLVQADDEILLVAAGDVIAGVDLAQMRDGDVVIDPVRRSVQLTVPEPQILSVALDNERTYVHSRRTDLLAERGEQMETRARQLAQSTIHDAALEAGILERAKESAEHTLTPLVRSLGYDRVTLRWAGRGAAPDGPR